MRAGLHGGRAHGKPSRGRAESTTPERRGSVGPVDACPDPSALEAFGQGTLDAAAREALEVHLDRCSACATLLAQLTQIYGSALATGSRADDRPTLGEGPSASSSASLHADATGICVGRYELGRLLGAGGMGVVYEAADPELHRRIAIKLLHPGVSGDVEATRNRMLREARAMAQLAHPNVVAVHDVGRVGEQVFVAMELVPGTTLTKWLTSTRRTRAEILATFVQAGRGLEAAHAVGLVHRDFKPDNVLIGLDGRARVTDFGLARPALSWPEGSHDTAAVAAAAAGLGVTSHMSTAHGAIVGTPAYMAPEQWRGVAADARSDQFSFCVALYEACFGARPFGGDGFYELAEQVLRGRLIPPPRSAPTWLRAALVRGLQLDPDARHPSFSVLLHALERDRTRVRRVAGVVGAMGLSVATTVGVLAWTADATSAAPPAVGLAAPAIATAEVPAAPPPSPPPTIDPQLGACLERAADAAGRWRTARRSELEARVRTMDDGDAIATRSLRVLDAWATRWTELSASACAPPAGAAHVEAERRCLASALPRFDALVQHALELPTFQVDDSLAAAALRLPDLSMCSDAIWLAVAPAPIDAAKLGEAALVDGELASAEALVHLDQLTSAPEAVDRALTRAVALGHAPLVAAAQLALGVAQLEKYETDAAVEALQAAATTAQGGVDDRVFARASLLLIEQTGGPQQRSADALRWERLLAPLASRLGDPWLDGALALASASALHGRAEYGAALEQYDVAIRELGGALGPTHPEVARAQLGAAATHLALDQADRATELAAAADTALRESVGGGDLRYAAARAMVARAALGRGDLDAAGQAADAAAHIPLFSQSLRHDFDHGTYLGLVGDVAAARGDTAAALASYEKAKIYLYVDAPKATPLLWEARLRIDTGTVREGLARLTEAAAILDEYLGPDDPRRIDPLVAIGRAQRRAGQIAAARTTLERAVAIAEASYGFAARTSLVQHELAALEAGAGNDARALELYDDAHVALGGAFDLGHPRLVASLLARADLAHALGQREYAARLYGSIADELMQQRGPKDAATMRARSRRGKGDG